MKVCMIVNNVMTEREPYTTTVLAHKMHNRKHEVFYMGIEDLSYYPEGNAGGRAAKADENKKFRTRVSYLENLKANYPNKEKILFRDIDIVLLRNDPAEEDKTRAWARVAGISFGQMAIQEGVIVLNDANGLSHALNKIYFQQFPQEVRPETIISRSYKEINEFFLANKKSIIVKPLFGSGGRSVFQVNEDNIKNLKQMIEAIGQEGYVVAQEFVPESVSGDTRVFLMNGSILKYKGKYAAVKRETAADDIRSNLHAGGAAKPAVITDEILKIAELVRPNLIRDGMFFVGLDIIGSKLIEVNVFSAGGLFSASKFADVDFPEYIIQNLEHKVYLKSIYKGQISNRRLATM
jgi:glutathione synthase